MIEIISGLPKNVVAFSAHGLVNGEDYEKVIVPVVEERLKVYGKIRFFYHVGKDFTGYTAAAIWDDARIGLRHFTAFEKIAVVTDIGWVADATKFFRIFIPCPVEVFGNDKFVEAKVWISE